MDPQLKILLAVLFLLLGIASVIGWVLEKRNQQSNAVIRNLNARIKAWWVMCLFFSLAVLLGPKMTLALFTLMSFLALREFVTLIAPGRGDHRSLFWAFFVITPIQYYLIGIGWYGMSMIFIPVYGCLWMPIRNALAGDTENYMARTALVQWALMVCVYFVSHAPALLFLKIPGYVDQNAKILFFLVIVVQMSDVLQYVWGKTLGKHPIAPALSPGKTIEGFVGGILSASLVGMAMYRITPFSWWQAGLFSLLICIMGFFGGLVMSAIKRDRGVKDFGSFIEGHGGMLDRIDSIIFSAPLFFHLVRFYFS
ncbi:phosphatidate cytidylyltransferase [Kiritimatiellota bacterium B12222]|nr:phosphatidate cytidylyltransferase [Kiritimatiellota bacterium B12222]